MTETEKLYEKQKEYCEKRQLPLFINASCTCPRCGRFLFGEYGIDPEVAGRMLITACPRCHTSFCD